MILLQKKVLEKITIILLVPILMICLLPASAHGNTYKNDAYLVPVITSYANPETGEIVDGGSNQALGESMCQSIMEKQALVEIWDNEVYVTLGVGLASNVGETKILIQGKTGVNQYKQAALTKTGTSEKDGDICNHYRFLMSDPKVLISPVLYVTPMGREVQFFVQLDMDKIESGAGIYVSDIVTEKEKQAEEAAKGTVTNITTNEITKESTEKKTKQQIETTIVVQTSEPASTASEKETQTTKAAETKKENLGSLVPVIIGVAVVSVLVMASVLFLKKRSRS